MFYGESRTWTEEAKPGTGRRRLPVPRRYFWHCPLGCDSSRFEGRQCAIVRTQIRGVTMRCIDCGVQFTVTYHQLARAHRRRLELMGKASPEHDANRTLADLDWLASLAGERRGRQRQQQEAPGGTR